MEYLLESLNLAYLAHEVGGKKPVGPATGWLGKPVNKPLGQPVHAAEVFLRVIGGVGFGGQVIRDSTRIWDCGGAEAEGVQSKPVGEPWQVGSGGHHLESAMCLVWTCGGVVTSVSVTHPSLGVNHHSRESRTPDRTRKRGIIHTQFLAVLRNAMLLC